VPSAILYFQKKIFGPIHTLWDPILYEHTKFGEDTLIGGEDMPQKQILKKRPLTAEFYFRFQD